MLLSKDFETSPDGSFSLDSKRQTSFLCSVELRGLDGFSGMTDPGHTCRNVQKGAQESRSRFVPGRTRYPSAVFSYRMVGGWMFLFWVREYWGNEEV